MIPTCLYRPRGLGLNRGILSWSMLGHVLSEEQSKVGSDGASDDGCLTIVQCHHYHRPPSSDLYRSSVGILPHSNTTNQTCILIIVITNQHHVLSTAAQPQPHHAPHMFHVPGQSYRACTSFRGHESRSPQGPARIYVGILRHHLEYESPCYMFILLFTFTPYMFMFCLCINTPVCCMYFASLNINLATYFSLTCSRLLKLLLSLTPDSPTPSGPPKFEASIKRAVQPTS